MLSRTPEKVLKDNLWDLLQEQALVSPDKIAFRILGRDLAPEVAITYADLVATVRRRAGGLASSGLVRQRVVLTQSTGLDWIVSFFAVMAVGGTAVPINSRVVLKPSEGLTAMLGDAEPAAILVEESTYARLNRNCEAASLPCGILVSTRLDQNSPVTLDAEESHNNIAVIQYTSGSTNAPKGICISHANFASNARLLTRTFQASSDGRTVSWLPLYHDMGLMTGIIWPVVEGASSVLMKPSLFGARPSAWLRAISDWSGTISAAPNFAYQACIDRVSDEELESLDLSAWRVAICGAEPVRADTIERFAERFAVCGLDRRSLCPSYGLAEATLFVSGGPIAQGPEQLVVDAERLQQFGEVTSPTSQSKARALVSCGRIGDTLDAIIVDPHSKAILGSSKVGEIWLRGPSIAEGYLGANGQNTSIFRAKPAVAESSDEGYLRTGDLGFMQNGNLYVAGRLKDLIIVRGANYAPHDLELTAQRSHPALLEGRGVAFALEGAENGGLVIVHEVGRGHEDVAAMTLDPVRENISRLHGLALYAVSVVPPRTLDLTTSGKVRRQPTKEAWLRGDFTTLAHWGASPANLARSV